ncbi:hypothetical protein JXA85_00900 [Candidatus Woesearchaeota archaeon]|nr:hypothetical protein [Candidatus Woesearchaeota archaeon]
MEESVLVWEEEEDFFESQRKGIEEYIANQLSEKVLKEISGKAKEIEELTKLLRNSRKRKSSAPVENLAIGVYRRYYGLEPETQEFSGDSPDILDIKIGKISPKEGKDILTACLKKNILFDGNRVYYLETITTTKEQPHCVKINNRTYGLKYASEIRAIEEKYRDALKQRIESIVNSLFVKFDGKRDELKAKITNLKEEIEANSISAENYRNLRLRRVSDNEYQFILTVKPFILVKKDRYYFCKATKLILGLAINNEYANIPSIPEIEKGYENPFVFKEKGLICYGDNKDLVRKELSDMGFSSTRPYSIKDPVLVKVIVSLFNYAENKLEKSWGDDVERYANSDFVKSPLSGKAEAKRLAILNRCRNRFFYN